MQIGDAVNLAIEHEKAGRLAEAESVCRSIVEEHPHTAAAWNLLAMIAARSGNDQLALENLLRAITADPQSAALHANLGELKRKMGRVDESLAAFHAAAGLEPNSPVLHNKLGIALRMKGNLPDSAVEFARAIALDGAYADPHNNLGNTLRDIGRFDEAIAEYRAAIAIKPNLADARLNLANIFAERGQFDAALAEFHAVLRIQPNHAEGLIRLAKLLGRMSRFDEAIAICRHALQVRPNSAEGLNVLGSLHYAREEFDEASAAFTKAIEADPQIVMTRNNLAMALAAAGKLDEGISMARSAVEMNPEYTEGFNTLGHLLNDRGDYDEAAKAFRRAIELRPDYPLPHWNLSLILLLRGDFENGWAEHEWRRKTNVESRPREFPQPFWDGGDPRGKTILVHQEQGYGDMLQFIRFAPLVAERGGRVVVSCAPELSKLFREMPQISAVCGSDNLPSFDFHCPILSLPYAFKTRVDSIPANVPYLKAPADTAERWAQTLGPRDGKLRVGLAWMGNPKRRLNTQRSVTLELLMPLSKIDGAKFYSLQKGRTAAIPDGFEMVDLSGKLTDFAETAGAIANLDLVISVDTAVAHLAGAMGKPAWVLIGYVPASRWMLDRNDSPWYPSMRLFRQPAMDDWKTPIGQVAEALRKLIDG
jgi:tetratricopeptide (TPR) repeat protein